MSLSVRSVKWMYPVAAPRRPKTTRSLLKLIAWTTHATMSPTERGTTSCSVQGENVQQSVVGDLHNNSV